MNKYLCVFICFFVGVIIFLLMKSYSRSNVVEGYCCMKSDGEKISGGIIIKNMTGKDIDVMFDITLPPCNASKGGSCSPPKSDGNCDEKDKVYGEKEETCSWTNHDAKFYRSENINENTKINDLPSPIPVNNPIVSLNNNNNLFMKLPSGDLKNMQGIINKNKLQWCSNQSSLGGKNICTGSRINFKQKNGSDPKHYSVIEWNLNRRIITQEDNNKAQDPVNCDPTTTPPGDCPDGSECPESGKCKAYNGYSGSGDGEKYYVDLSNVDGININTQITFNNAALIYEGSNNVYSKNNYEKISCSENAFDLEPCKTDPTKCYNPSQNTYPFLGCTNPTGVDDGGMNKVLCHNLWNTDSSKVCNVVGVNTIEGQSTDIYDPHINNLTTTEIDATSSSDAGFNPSDSCNTTLNQQTTDINNAAANWVNSLNKYVDSPGNLTDDKLNEICQGYNWAYDEQICLNNKCFTTAQSTSDFIKNNLIDNPFKPLKTLKESYIKPNDPTINPYNTYKDEPDKLLIIIEIHDII